MNQRRQYQYQRRNQVVGNFGPTFFILGCNKTIELTINWLNNNSYNATDIEKYKQFMKEQYDNNKYNNPRKKW